VDELAARRRVEAASGGTAETEVPWAALTAEWEDLQARVRADPIRAIVDVEVFIREWLAALGCPPSARAVPSAYRAARAALPGWGKRPATREEVDRAMVHYRRLVGERRAQGERPPRAA